MNPFLPGRSRDSSRLVELVQPHVQLMYRMAYRWTQSPEAAEDLVQDVLLKLIDRNEDLESIDQPRPWLIRILYRRYVDLYRRQTRSPVVEPGWLPDPELLEEQLPDRKNDIEQTELRQSLLRALATLDDEQRDTVLLHDVEGHSALETAEILDISVGTVKSRLHRARKKLREFLDAGTF